MTANISMSNVRVFHLTPSVESRLVDAADQYEHAVSDVESGCCAGPHCACDTDACHYGRRDECVDCTTAAVGRLEVARDDLARLVVKAGLAEAVAEVAR